MLELIIVAYGICWLLTFIAASSIYKAVPIIGQTLPGGGITGFGIMLSLAVSFFWWIVVPGMVLLKRHEDRKVVISH